MPHESTLVQCYITFAEFIDCVHSGKLIQILWENAGFLDKSTNIAQGCKKIIDVVTDNILSEFYDIARKLVTTDE